MNKLVSMCVAMAVTVGVGSVWPAEARPALVGPEDQVANQPLLNRHWIVDTVLADRVVYPVPPDIHVSLLFRPAAGNQVTVSGTLICNWLSGIATVEGDTLTVEGLGTTKRGCQPDDPRVEIGVFTALKGVSQYWIDGDQLTIAKPTGPGLILHPAF